MALSQSSRSRKRLLEQVVMRQALSLLMLLTMTTALVAAPPEQWRPIDQAVEDLDALGTSLRRVEPGLRSDGEQTSLFQVPADEYGQSQLYRVGPGFRARVDRVDYLVRRDRRDVAFNVAPRHDGEFVELAPTQTVYELTPMPAVVVNPPPATGADARVNRQVDGRVGSAPARGPVYINGSRPPRTSGPPPATPTSEPGRARDRDQGVVQQPHRAQPARDQGHDPAR
jgi:hypothetical protein